MNKALCRFLWIIGLVLLVGCGSHETELRETIAQGEVERKEQAGQDKITKEETKTEDEKPKKREEKNVMNQDNQDEEIPEEKEENQTQGKEENFQEEIEDYQIIWNSKHTYGAFIKGNDEVELKLYIVETNQNTIKEIAGIVGNLYDITWAPNGQYMTVNEGTSTVYTTYIVQIDEEKIIDQVVNVRGPVWSPDSRSIAFGVLNDEEPAVMVEWEGTSDLVIDHLSSKKTEVLLHGQKGFNYFPIEWTEDGLAYRKSYFTGGEEQYTLQVGEYDIVPKVAPISVKNVESNLVYPVIQNMKNQEAQKQLNRSIAAQIQMYTLFLQGGIQEGEKLTLEGKYTVACKTKNILSFVYTLVVNIEGAPHPNVFLESMTVDLNTGTPLTLQEMFTENAEDKAALNPILKEEINKLDFPLLKEFEGIEDGQKFYMTPNSMIIYYQEGEYTPHAQGPLLLEIPLKNIEDVLTPLL